MFIKTQFDSLEL